MDEGYETAGVHFKSFTIKYTAWWYIVYENVSVFEKIPNSDPTFTPLDFHSNNKIPFLKPPVTMDLLSLFCYIGCLQFLFSSNSFKIYLSPISIKMITSM